MRGVATLLALVLVTALVDTCLAEVAGSEPTSAGTTLTTKSTTSTATTATATTTTVTTTTVVTCSGGWQDNFTPPLPDYRSKVASYITTTTAAQDAATTAQECALKCLQESTCASFSFNSNSLKRLCKHSFVRGDITADTDAEAWSYYAKQNCTTQGRALAAPGPHIYFFLADDLTYVPAATTSRVYVCARARVCVCVCVCVRVCVRVSVLDFIVAALSEC